MKCLVTRLTLSMRNAEDANRSPLLQVMRYSIYLQAFALCAIYGENCKLICFAAPGTALDQGGSQKANENKGKCFSFLTMSIKHSLVRLGHTISQIKHNRDGDLK